MHLDADHEAAVARLGSAVLDLINVGVAAQLDRSPSRPRRRPAAGAPRAAPRLHRAAPRSDVELDPTTVALQPTISRVRYLHRVVRSPPAAASPSSFAVVGWTGVGATCSNPEQARATGGRGRRSMVKAPGTPPTSRGRTFKREYGVTARGSTCAGYGLLCTQGRHAPRMAELSGEPGSSLLVDLCASPPRVMSAGQCGLCRTQHQIAQLGSDLHEQIVVELDLGGGQLGRRSGPATSSANPGRRADVQRVAPVGAGLVSCAACTARCARSRPSEARRAGRPPRPRLPRRTP